MSTDGFLTVVGRQYATGQQPHELPAQLPRPRGPMTVALLDCLRRDPASTRVKPARLTWSGATAEATTDHDLQLALWLAYELPYRGLVGVDDAWECHPGLVEVIEEWECLLLDALVDVTSSISMAVAPEAAPSSTMAAGSSDQFRELLVHRSIYYLKEADLHTWGIPVAGASNPETFRSFLAEWGLSTRYGHYLNRVPGITLLTSNMISMFRRHRRFRAALAGHLAVLQKTALVPNAGHAREDILFGARCAAYADEQFAAWVLPRWAAGQSSLLHGFSD
jgi:heme oxygenase-like protein